jgi:hypothetical protein
MLSSFVNKTPEDDTLGRNTSCDLLPHTDLFLIFKYCVYILISGVVDL